MEFNAIAIKSNDNYSGRDSVIDIPCERSPADSLLAYQPQVHVEMHEIVAMHVDMLHIIAMEVA